MYALQMPSYLWAVLSFPQFPALFIWDEPFLDELSSQWVKSENLYPTEITSQSFYLCSSNTELPH